MACYKVKNFTFKVNLLTCRLRAIASSTIVSSSASGGMSSIGGKAPGAPSNASIGFTFTDTPLAPAPVK
jgi:hypothetical protein